MDMKAEQIEALEGYFKTENEHWNGYAFEILCETLQQGSFKNPETPLQLFGLAVDLITKHSQTPLKALQELQNSAHKEGLNSTQKLFVFEWVYNYLENSEFDEVQPVEFRALLKSQIEWLKKEKPNPDKPLIGNIRETLKELLQKEINALPETLKTLEPVQRLNVLCKLIPFVLPKVEAVHSEQGEQ
jgi:hypothetical protein